MTQDLPLRLERALAALFRFQEAGGGDREAFLAGHADLRDILEPMLAESAAEAAPQPLALGSGEGRSVGGFRLVREVGRGGMGVVYEAWHETLERKAAVKLLHSDRMLTPTAVGRFVREGRTLARLDHPGIVRILDLGQDQGTHWLAMEFVSGQPFDQWLATARERMPATARLRAVVDIVAQVAAALQHAHDHGIVHRDVKPSNILVRDDATAVVTDFGLARDAEMLTVTQPGMAAGTPFYMAPEQIRGGAWDARVDVFQLGVTLFEAVTDQRPFRGGTTEAVFQAILRDEAPDPRRHNTAVSADLAAVVAMALEKEPARRYASAAALLADLRAVLDLRPVVARPVSTLVRVRRWVAREPVRALLVLVLLVGGLAVAGLGGYLVALRPELLAARQAQLEAEFEEALAAGYDHHSARRTAAACAAFDQALRLQPGRAEAMVAAALARQRRDGAAAALSFLDAAERAAPPDHPDDVARMRAVFLHRLGRKAEAEQTERTLRPPDRPAALHLAAVANQDQGGPLAESLRLCSLAVRTAARPRAALWMQWAVFAGRSQDAALRIEAAEAITRLWPMAWRAWHAAAGCWQGLDKARAVAAQERALELGAGSVEAWVNLGIYLAQAGRPAEVAAAHQRAIARFPDEVSPRFHLMRWLIDQGDFAAAAAEFPGIARIDPRHAPSLELMGQVLCQQERDAEALQYFRQATAVTPEAPWLWLNFGATLRYSGNLQQAESAVRKSLEFDPLLREAHVLLVEILRERGDAKGVLAEHERLVQTLPLDATAWLELSQAQLKAQVEPVATLRSAARAVWLSQGRSLAALEHLAAVHSAGGETQAAVAALQEAWPLTAGDAAEARRDRARIARQLRALGAEPPASRPESRSR